jgi:YbbR domain-containing protein
VDVSYLDPPEIESVSLSLTIQRVKEILLQLTVIPGGGATMENTIVTQSHTSIQVSGSEQMLEELGDTIHLGELRLAEITKDGQKEFFFNLPKGITNLSMSNNQVTVSVKFDGLKTKTLRATNIQPRNVPAGLMAEIMAKELIVNIRGPEAQINLLTEENVIIAVDFANAEVGTTASYPVLVYIVDADDCGVVGNYSVYAKVTEEQANQQDPAGT